MLASITAYDIGVFLHVTAVVVAFGVTFAFPFLAATAGRLDPRSLPVVHAAIAQIEKFLITPGLIVVFFAGVWAVEDGNIGYGESWVSVGMAAIIVLALMHFLLFVPGNRKGGELIERDLAEGGEGPSEEYVAIVERISRGGQLATLIILVTIFFMVVKP